MIRTNPSRWWLALILLAGLITTPIIAGAMGAPLPFSRLLAVDSGTGYDPLTEHELERVRQEALADPAAADSLSGVTRQELLLVERHQEEKSVYETGRWDRRADIYIYNYDSDTLLHIIHNLSAGRIDSIESSQNVQLPLTENEVNRAVAIAFNDPQLRPLLDEQYARITGEALTTPEQVEIKAFVFYANALPDMELGAAASCGLNRCAQLLLFTRESLTFELLPVINLSTEAVAFVPFGANNGQ
jgi:hypothetical protein